MPETTDNEDWGTLFVSRKCCGAATCRNFAPELLGEVAPAHPLHPDEARGAPVLPGSFEEGSFTGVLRQPRNQADLEAARTAVAACPFGAIQLKTNRARVRPGELGSPWKSFPRRIEDNVWVLGHPSPQNFGALAYFIELAGGGLLIDPPRPSDELFRWLDEHGGVRWLLLTHRDHTHHHAEIAARFPGCRRIIGAADVRLRATPYMEATGDVEIKLGDSPLPMGLDGTPIPEGALPYTDIAVLPQPGHTPGSLCVVYRGRFLFTGDHVFYSRRLDRIVAARLQCWEEWQRQTESVRRLAAWAESGLLRFAWILPGHGEWHCLENNTSQNNQTPDTTAAAKALRRGLEWMERRAPGHVPLAPYIPFIQSRMKPKSAIARIMRAIGGEGGGSDAWILPRGARSALPDFDPQKTRAAHRRAYLITAAALALTAGAVGLAARASRALAARRS
jgi:glyoxylase-like metal-dependent hydrolase (beta-lactamase superfamily II)